MVGELMKFYKEAINNLNLGIGYTVYDNDWENIHWAAEISQDTLDKIEELKAKEPMKVLRFKRDRLLAESDWTQMPDVENELKEKWKEYRQALRDLPSKSEPKLEHNELLNVEFPQKPEQLNGD